MKLDFGSGYNPQSGYLSCDFTYMYGLDYVFDSENYRVSCPDHEFTTIRCRNVLHHVEDLDRIFKEFHRILKPGGELIIIDANKEHFKINTILDTVWYRYIFKRYDIQICKKYRDFVPLLEKNGFIVENQYNKAEKIIINLKKGDLDYDRRNQETIGEKWL